MLEPVLIWTHIFTYKSVSTPFLRDLKLVLVSWTWATYQGGAVIRAEYVE